MRVPAALREAVAGTGVLFVPGGQSTGGAELWGSPRVRAGMRGELLAGKSLAPHAVSGLPVGLFLSGKRAPADLTAKHLLGDVSKVKVLGWLGTV